MTPEQVALVALFALVAIFQFVAQALKARRARDAAPAELPEPDTLPPPPPSRQPSRPPSRHVRDATRAGRGHAESPPRHPDGRRRAPVRARARLGPRQVREAIVLTAILAPPRGLEPPESAAGAPRPRAM